MDVFPRSRIRSLIVFDRSYDSSNRQQTSCFRHRLNRRTVATTMNLGALLNLVGLSTGVVLYSMLLAIVVRARRTPNAHGRLNPLLLLTSVLGLVWNSCAQTVYELPKVGIMGPFLPRCLGLQAPGFLPAVVVRSVLRGERDDVQGTGRHTLAGVAYGVSAVPGLLHVVAAVGDETVPSAIGTRLLTSTFVAHVVPLFAATRATSQAPPRPSVWSGPLLSRSKAPVGWAPR